MRIETTKRALYKFNELSKDQKQRAIENLWDINVDLDWWDFTYDDATDIGVKLTGFDIDRGSYCNGEPLEGYGSIAQSILENHGKVCDTYKLAETFLKAKEQNDQKEPDEGTEGDKWDIWDLRRDNMEDKFMKNLLSEYLTMLRNEYEHLTGEQAIIETINANEYEFDKHGKLA